MKVVMSSFSICCTCNKGGMVNSGRDDPTVTRSGRRMQFSWDGNSAGMAIELRMQLSWDGDSCGVGLPEYSSAEGRDEEWE